MQKLDYVLLGFSYLVAFVYVSFTGNVGVSNPNIADYLDGGIWSMFGYFLGVSIFTLPIQFFSGWNKFAYIRKTLIASLVFQVIFLVFELF